MATNKYIGERYVPLMSGQWVKTKEYEPLTIVINEGNSYTSKKHVPSGVEITNTEYWAPTGNYNAQIEQYRQDVANLQKNVTDTNETVAGIQEDVETINGDVETLNNKYTSLSASIGLTNTNVSNLTKRVTALEEKQSGLVLISDSYADFEGNTFVNQIKNANLFDVFYEAHAGGAGFGIGSTTFIDLLNQVSNTITDKNSITTILVAGGYNDYAVTEDNILGAINTFMIRAKQLFKNANVKIAFIGWGKQTSHWRGLVSACGAYSKCGKYGATYITGSEYILHDYSFFDEAGAFHPNQNGHNALANYLISGLLNGGCDVVYPYKTIDYTPRSGVTAESPDGMAVILNGGNVQLLTVKMIFHTPSTMTTMNGRNAILLGTIANGYLYGDGDNLTTCDAMVIYKDTASKKYRKCPAQLVFSNGEMRIALMDIRDNGSDFLATTVNEIQILSINHVFSALRC